MRYIFQNLIGKEQRLIWIGAESASRPTPEAEERKTETKSEKSDIPKPKVENAEGREKAASERAKAADDGLAKELQKAPDMKDVKPEDAEKAKKPLREKLEGAKEKAIEARKESAAEKETVPAKDEKNESEKKPETLSGTKEKLSNAADALVQSIEAKGPEHADTKTLVKALSDQMARYENLRDQTMKGDYANPDYSFDYQTVSAKNETGISHGGERYEIRTGRYFDGNHSEISLQKLSDKPIDAQLRAITADVNNVRETVRREPTTPKPEDVSPEDWRSENPDVQGLLASLNAKLQAMPKSAIYNPENNTILSVSNGKPFFEKNGYEYTVNIEYGRAFVHCYQTRETYQQGEAQIANTNTLENLSAQDPSKSAKEHASELLTEKYQERENNRLTIKNNTDKRDALQKENPQGKAKDIADLNRTTAALITKNLTLDRVIKDLESRVPVAERKEKPASQVVYSAETGPEKTPEQEVKEYRERHKNRIGSDAEAAKELVDSKNIDRAKLGKTLDAYGKSLVQLEKKIAANPDGDNTKDTAELNIRTERFRELQDQYRAQEKTIETLVAMLPGKKNPGEVKIAGQFSVKDDPGVQAIPEAKQAPAAAREAVQPAAAQTLKPESSERAATEKTAPTSAPSSAPAASPKAKPAAAPADKADEKNNEKAVKMLRSFLATRRVLNRTIKETTEDRDLPANQSPDIQRTITDKIATLNAQQMEMKPLFTPDGKSLRAGITQAEIEKVKAIRKSLNLRAQPI